MIGEVETLHPAFRIAVDRILRDMRAMGWDAVIGSGMRSNQMQDALYAQGRKSLKKVNALRKQVSLPPVTTSANLKTVTNAKGGQSNHNLTTTMLPSGRSAIDTAYGFAVDIVDRRDGWEIKDGKFWSDLGTIAKQHGCGWGGDWKKSDPAHVEMKLIDAAPSTSFVV